MDTSKKISPSSVDLILGAQVPQGEIDQENWLRIVERVFKEVRPRLKYLSGLMSVKDYGNKKMCLDRYETKISESILRDSGLEGTERVFSLTGLPVTPEMKAWR